MAFKWVFPEGTSEEVVTNFAGLGPVYLNDGFQLEWTPQDKRVTILLACDETGGSYFIGNRSYDASPGFWRLTDQAVSDESPNCHFAYDGPHGNAKLFKYMNTSNPKGATTWSTSSSALAVSTSSSSSASTASFTSVSETSSVPTTDITSSSSSLRMPPASATPNISSDNNSQPAHTNSTAIGMGIGLSVAFIVVLSVTILLCWRWRNRRAAAVADIARQEKAHVAASPVELACERTYELNGESRKLEMESQDRRRINVTELG